MANKTLFFRIKSLLSRTAPVNEDCALRDAVPGTD